MVDLGAAPASAGPHAAAPPRGRVLGFFREPARAFLALALLAGGYLACVVPHFGGIDESAHFYRSYQISTGHFLPQKLAGSGFSGACVPADVVRQVHADAEVYFRHQLEVAHLPPQKLGISTRHCGGDQQHLFVTFSTFGSPVPYLPQSAAIFVARTAGADVDGMLVFARLVVLLGYVGIVFVAIRRSPRSKWALCAVGLMPVAVFQSASSISHDALTTAVSLLVVSSALRALDPPDGVSNRALVVEALLLSALLGSCKPTYVVVAGCYLLPLLGPRRRRERWPLLFAPVVGVLATAAWTKIAGNLWKTDAGYFGIRADDAHQRHELLTEPWNFAGDLARSLYHQLWYWVHTLFTVGPSATRGPAILAVAAIVIYCVVSVQSARSEPEALHWQQRLLVLAVFALGALLIAVANYLYWTDPFSSQVGGMQPRYFMPVVVLLPVAVGGLRAPWLRSSTAKVPLAVLLVPALVVFCVIVTFSMY